MSTLPIVWLPEADAELQCAIAYYSAIREELGQRFSEAVVDTLERVSLNPLQYAVLSGGRRRAGIHRFPYGLFFLVEDTRIVVVACFHGARDPRHWNLRWSRLD